MRAIVFDRPGDVDVLRLEERPSPTPGRGEVRVRVHGSGLNRVDLLQRRGLYPPPKGSPTDVLGVEYAGVIDEVGGNTGLTVGESVMGVIGGGAYAEQIIVPADEVMRAPAGMSLQHAAAVPEAFMTAYDGLFTEGALERGDAVLIHAVGSGVGTAALQLANRAGARVIGTSRSAEKLLRAKLLGDVDGVVSDAQWPNAVKQLAPEGVDVVFDLVGGAMVRPSLAMLRDRGRHVLIGLTAGSTAELDLGRLLSKRLILRGTVLRTRPVAEKIVLAQAIEQHVVPHLTTGLLRPVVDSLVAPSAIREAHQRLERNDSFGKLVIDWTKT